MVRELSELMLCGLVVPGPLHHNASAPVSWFNVAPEFFDSPPRASTADIVHTARLGVASAHCPGMVLHAHCQIRKEAGEITVGERSRPLPGLLALEDLP